jgi:hypothetical protein
MNPARIFLILLIALLFAGGGMRLYAGEYSFPGYLPKVERLPGAVMIKIHVLGEQEDFYIHYRTEGPQEFQVRKMKAGKQGNFYHRLATERLYGNAIEYFIAATDQPIPGSLAPVFTIAGFTGEDSPEIYFLDAGPGDKENGSGSKFRFPLDVDPSLSTTARIYDDNEYPGESFDANGNIGLSRTIAGKKSQLDFESNITYTHIVDEDENKFDLSDMRVDFKTGNHTLSAGDLSIRSSKFTASSLNRRGLRYKMKGKRLYLGSFFTNAQQKTGFSGFGAPPSDSHIFGAEAGFDFGKTGSLHGIFMTGKDNLNSRTVVSAGDDMAYREGSVYSIRGQFKLFEKKLDLKGEFAHSTFGYGRGSGDVNKENDNAWYAEAMFKHGIVSARADYNKIGRYFSSIGNLFLSNDRQGLNSKIDLEIKSFSLDIGYKDHKTNVNDDIRPMMHTRDIETGFNWIIDDRFTVGGRVSLNNLAYDRSTGAQTGSEDMDTIAYEANLGYADGPNSIMFNLGKTESKTFSSDIDASIDIVLKFGKVLRISPRFSYQANRDLTDGTISRRYNPYIRGELTIIPKYFSMTFSVSGAKNVYTDGEYTSLDARGNLKFLMAELFKKKIKPVLSINSKYQHRKNRDGSEKSYVTVYLQLDISL